MFQNIRSVMRNSKKEVFSRSHGKSEFLEKKFILFFCIIASAGIVVLMTGCQTACNSCQMSPECGRMYHRGVSARSSECGVCVPVSAGNVCCEQNLCQKESAGCYRQKSISVNSPKYNTSWCRECAGLCEDGTMKVIRGDVCESCGNMAAGKKLRICRTADGRVNGCGILEKKAEEFSRQAELLKNVSPKEETPESENKKQETFPEPSVIDNVMAEEIRRGEFQEKQNSFQEVNAQNIPQNQRQREGKGKKEIFPKSEERIPEKGYTEKVKEMPENVSENMEEKSLEVPPTRILKEDEMPLLPEITEPIKILEEHNPAKIMPEIRDATTQEERNMEGSLPATYTSGSENVTYPVPRIIESVDKNEPNMSEPAVPAQMPLPELPQDITPVDLPDDLNLEGELPPLSSTNSILRKDSLQKISEEKNMSFQRGKIRSLERNSSSVKFLPVKEQKRETKIQNITEASESKNITLLPCPDISWKKDKNHMNVITYELSHPLNRVNARGEEVIYDTQIQQTVMQEVIPEQPENMEAGVDADALADLAQETEEKSVKARREAFTNIPDPRYHDRDVFPHDEYIIDTTKRAHIQELKGRREGTRVVPNDRWQSEIQDTEGTIIHFSTPSGHSALQSTEPVYIYAPRFRAVRQVTDPTTNAQVLKLGNLDSPVQLNTQQRTVGAERSTQNTQAILSTGRDQMALFHGKSSGGEISSGQVVKGFQQDMVIPQENAQATVLNQYKGAQLPWNSEMILRANTWGGTEQMSVFVDHQRAAANIAAQNTPSLYVVVEKAEKPQVKIYKVASSDSAKSGENVTFMIRFENTGNVPISNIIIVDNLSPRLELDPSSSVSSMDVDFRYEPNEKGSVLLRWEITEPLPPGQWGAVKFNCTVR
ncbi:MAG: hypothetical protein Q4C96_04835 [Planctomycetia bacterium]|nr:hypothetical protein [Planctomycetia bacterium]